jgi:hypothetical protein
LRLRPALPNSTGRKFKVINGWSGNIHIARFHTRRPGKLQNRKRHTIWSKMKVTITSKSKKNWTLIARYSPEEGSTFFVLPSPWLPVGCASLPARNLVPRVHDWTHKDSSIRFDSESQLVKENHRAMTWWHRKKMKSHNPTTRKAHHHTTYSENSRTRERELTKAPIQRMTA